MVARVGQRGGFGPGRAAGTHVEHPVPRAVPQVGEPLADGPAEKVQTAGEFDERAAADLLRERGTGRPPVRGEVVDPDLLGRRSGVVSDETPGQVDLTAVERLPRVRNPRAWARG